MGYKMNTRCPTCGGTLYNDIEFGMIQCLDCKWYTTDDTEISRIVEAEVEAQLGDLC
jgi:ribosomal protein L37AE/L43A